MKKMLHQTTISTMSLWLLTSIALAQPIEPFKGRGMTDNNTSPPAWFGSSRPTSSESKAGPTWFGGQGSMRPARPNEMEERPRLFGSFFQRSESSGENLFQKANERSRDVWDRTRNWAQDQNETIKSRTVETWESLTRGLRANEFHYETPPSPYAPNGGPVRMAENHDSNRTDRF